MTRIISFVMSVLFAFDMFFVGLMPQKTIEITQSDETIGYYINGESENGLLSFGVEGESNLFEPDEEVKIVVECRDEKLNGIRAGISVKSEQADFNKRGYICFDSSLPYNTFTFSCCENGIFTIQIQLPDKTEYSFKIGILPRNKQASDSFYYGIQPYITRSYLWGEGNHLPNFNAEESIEKILDTAEYLGVNLVREDSVGWSAMQSETFGDVDFSVQDYLVEKVNERGMKYNWLLGFNAGKWSVADKYKNDYDETIGWTCPPNEELWADFVQKVAEHYADNTDILWEIWNEPNWYFFAGTAEEYFSLLECTAEILKTANPSAYVYSGGLAVAEKETNLPYYQKSAELIDRKLLDNYGYHNHNGLENYYDYMNQMLSLTKTAGLDGGINSESGVVGTDAATIACKALYTRSTGAKGYVSFSFRKSVVPENDINNFAFFNEYLQPTEAVISYAAVIRFLGNAEFVKNVSNKKDLVIDEYSENGKKTEVYYSLGDTTRIAAPDGDYTAYDMYGNTIEIKRKIKVSNSPIYIVYN